LRPMALPVIQARGASFVVSNSPASAVLLIPSRSRSASTLRISAANFLRSSSLRPGFLQKYVCPLGIGVCLALFLDPFHYCKHLLNSKTFGTNTQRFCFYSIGKRAMLGANENPGWQVHSSRLAPLFHN
jgi:hypothetical protein